MEAPPRLPFYVSMESFTVLWPCSILPFLCIFGAGQQFRFFFPHLETWGLEITELKKNKIKRDVWPLERILIWLGCNMWLLPTGLSLISTEWLTLLNTTCLREMPKHQEEKNSIPKSPSSKWHHNTHARTCCLLFPAWFYSSSADVLSIVWIFGLQWHAVKNHLYRRLFKISSKWFALNKLLSAPAIVR